MKILNKPNPKVDQYLSQGCGRCKLFNTPECKVHNWTAELAKLREIALACGLTEELKWGVPVYTFEGKNVVLIAAFKNYCSVSFFKGVLLKDADGILSGHGENSQAGKAIKFTELGRIFELESVLKDYIREAVKIEKAGLKVEFKDVSQYEIPSELQTKFAENPAFKDAFYSLTPGRQKGYLLHFSQAKQAKTRAERIEKYASKIFSGKGLND